MQNVVKLFENIAKFQDPVLSDVSYMGVQYERICSILLELNLNLRMI